MHGPVLEPTGECVFSLSLPSLQSASTATPTPHPIKTGLDHLQNQLPSLDGILVPYFNLSSILIVPIPILLENFETKTTKEQKLFKVNIFSLLYQDRPVRVVKNQSSKDSDFLL